MKIAMKIAYEGGAYHGWQSQKNLSTVQSLLEHALTQVADQPVTITASGRTDQGVHALAQIIHFTTTAIRSERSWLFGSNASLPEDIRVLWVKPVASDFHARFSAVARHYRYVIYQNPVSLPWTRRYSLWHPKPLKVSFMLQAAQALVGEHDFSSFRAAACQSKSPIRSVHQLVVREQPPWIWVDITANAFLHHMVRNIVGTLIEVGEEKRSIDSVAELLFSRDRTRAAATARPQGLYLCRIDYPEKFGLPVFDKLTDRVPMF